MVKKRIILIAEYRFAWQLLLIKVDISCLDGDGCCDISSDGQCTLGDDNVRGHVYSRPSSCGVKAMMVVIGSVYINNVCR